MLNREALWNRRRHLVPVEYISCFEWALRHEMSAKEAGLWAGKGKLSVKGGASPVFKTGKLTWIHVEAQLSEKRKYKRTKPEQRDPEILWRDLDMLYRRQALKLRNRLEEAGQKTASGLEDDITRIRAALGIGNGIVRVVGEIEVGQEESYRGNMQVAGGQTSDHSRHPWRARQKV